MIAIKAIQHTWPGAEVSIYGDEVTWHSMDAPSDADLQSAIDVYTAHISATAYRGERAVEYPVIGDQLDAVWKELSARRINGENLVQDADDMLDAVLAVKLAHPKPE